MAGSRSPRDMALGLLARREHSRLELAIKLRQRGVSTAECGVLLDDLISEGLLSERRYVTAYARSRAARGFGPVRIIAELGQRGVRDAGLDSLIDTSDVEWTECAHRAREKKFGPAPASGWEDHEDERLRQRRYLENRGFTAPQIRAALAGRTHEEA